MAAKWAIEFHDVSFAPPTMKNCICMSIPVCVCLCFCLSPNSLVTSCVPTLPPSRTVPDRISTLLQALVGSWNSVDRVTLLWAPKTRNYSFSVFSIQSGVGWTYTQVTRICSWSWLTSVSIPAQVGSILIFIQSQPLISILLVQHFADEFPEDWEPREPKDPKDLHGPAYLVFDEVRPFVSITCS